MNNRNFGISILVLCFSLSSVNATLADQIVGVSPIIIDPNEIQALNQQMLDRDRQNRDEEIAIQGLVEQNNKLTEATLARQQDEGLAKINQTMLSYRNALLSRDRARIEANGEKWWGSRYGDLVKLTEDADAMTQDRGDLENKSGLLAQKYQMLTALKDEMTALNDKLENQGADKLNQKEKIIEGYKKIAQDQQDKIQMLVDRLGEMDKKISHFDEIIAQKDGQIARLQDNLNRARSENKDKDETIQQQESQIAILQGQPKDLSSNKNQNQADQLALQLSRKQEQVELLKEELENKITELKAKAGHHQSAASDSTQVEIDSLKSQIQQQTDDMNAKDKLIKAQADQIESLSHQANNHPLSLDTTQETTQAADVLKAKDQLIKTQADQMAGLSQQLKNQNATFGMIQSKVASLKVRIKNQMQQQNDELKAKDASIRWLNQVLAATKDKTEYYKLTAKEEHLYLEQFQEKVKQIKDDFAQRAKNDNQVENTIGSLKNQVSQLVSQLSRKQAEVDSLRGKLEDKITQLNNQNQQQVQVNGDLKAQLQDRDNQILRMKTDIQTIQLGQAKDDRLKLAQQLINLQQQESGLLDEKSDLALQQYDIFDRHFAVFETRMKTLIANRRIHDTDLQDQMDTLKNELGDRQQEVDSLKRQLEDKIANEKNSGQLQVQVQDLRAQLQDKEDQIISLKTQIKSGQVTYEESESLKQQLAAEQDKADQLKQQLDSKTAQSDQMTLMMSDYQKKLESKDNAYNGELGQVLSSRNYQARMEKQIADLNARLQEKEAHVVKIKKDMYELQELTMDKNRDLQAKDLSLSMVQQKMMDMKINEYQNKINGLQAARDNQAQEVKTLKTELALATQQLGGMPSSDEIEFLRTGLKKATMQLKQKDTLLSQAKANADEYEKESKEQSSALQSLKEQLQNAYDDLSHRNEDLKYKNLEVVRLKERSAIKEGELMDQIRALSRKQGVVIKESLEKPHGNKAELEAQLMSANARIKDLETQLNQFILPNKKDPLKEKLKQALDKIEEQGRMINILVKKLQDAGQSVNLTRAQ